MTAYDDLWLLRSFVRIAETGSISAAARALGQAQPTVSRQLSTLEARAGVVLVNRDTHRLRLTEEGGRLLKDARLLLAQADEAMHRLKHAQRVPAGHMRLVATTDIGQQCISRILGGFLQTHPGMTVELRYSSRPIHMLEEGYDAGIVVGAVPDDCVVSRRVAAVKRTLLVAPVLMGRMPKPLRFSDLKSWPWVVPTPLQPSHSGRLTATHPTLGRETIRFRPILSIDGITGLREAVRAGAGVGLISDYLAGDLVDRGELIPVLPHWKVDDLAVSLIHPAGGAVPLRVRAFLDYAEPQLGALLTQLDRNPALSALMFHPEGRTLSGARKA